MPDFDGTYVNAVVKARRQVLEMDRTEMKIATDPKMEPVAREGEPLIAEHFRLGEPVARNHHIDVTN